MRSVFRCTTTGHGRLQLPMEMLTHANVSLGSIPTLNYICNLKWVTLLSGCQCYGHADSCHYDEEINGGVCDNCTHNTAGINCEQCQPFFYRNTTTLRNDPDVCLGEHLSLFTVHVANQ